MQPIMTFHIVKNLFYILICIASVASNSLLITILLRFEHLRTTANLFVFNLAFCDITTVLLGIPFTIGVEESYSYPFGEAGCKILMPAATAAFNSAAFTLLAIAIDRFYAIMFPMRARLQSCKVKSLVLCLLHGLSIVSVIPFVIHQRYINKSNKNSCVEVWPKGGSRIYTLALFVIQYALPLTLIAVLYSVSWNQIRKKNKVIIKMQELQQRGKCHFSRSQSWDATMRTSDSFSFPIDIPSKGNGKAVIKSTSSYSFKSNHLEAVEERSSCEVLQTKADDDEREAEEEVPMINASNNKHVEDCTRIVTTKTGNNQTRSSDRSDHLLTGLGRSKHCSPVSDEGQEGVEGAMEMHTFSNNNEYDENARVASDDSLMQRRYKRNHISRIFKKHYNGKTSCLPSCTANLEEEETKTFEEIHHQNKSSEKGKKLSFEEETHSCPKDDKNERFTQKQHIAYTKLSQASYGLIDAESPVSDNIQTLPSDASTTNRAQIASEEVSEEAARHAQWQESGALMSKEEARECKMTHSASSPALSTCGAQTKTRRESMPTTLQKSANHQAELRMTRISQIALQAKRRLSQAMAPSSTENMCIASIKRMKQTRRTLRMFTCVIVVFAICMLPNQITWIWMAFNGAHLSHKLYTVFYFLTYTNSVINPWIYGAVNPSFRKAYRKVFGCQTRTQRRNPMRSSSKLSFLLFSRRSSDVTATMRNGFSRKAATENGAQSNLA